MAFRLPTRGIIHLRVVACCDPGGGTAGAAANACCSSLSRQSADKNYLDTVRNVATAEILTSIGVLVFPPPTARMVTIDSMKCLLCSCHFLPLTSQRRVPGAIVILHWLHCSSITQASVAIHCKTDFMLSSVTCFCLKMCILQKNDRPHELLKMGKVSKDSMYRIMQDINQVHFMLTW